MRSSQTAVKIALDGLFLLLYRTTSMRDVVWSESKKEVRKHQLAPCEALKSPDHPEKV
jgi:hypothetical protein